ncbi:ABC transporter substrate-binding protein [Petrachloros mirabilis]
MNEPTTRSPFNNQAWTTLLCAIIFLFAACPASKDTPLSASHTDIVFKHGKVVGDPQVMAGLLRDFEARHPDLRVREEILPSSSDQQHQFYAITLEGKQAPFDVIAVDTIWVQEFAKAGWIRPLQTILSPETRARYFPGPILAATYKDQLYAIPWYIDAGVLYYRKDLLDRYGFGPPETWLELVAAARAILDAEADPNLGGFVWQGKQYEGLVCVALEFLRSRGADLWEGDEVEAAEALQFMRDLIVRYHVTPAPVATADEEGTRHLFGSGRAIFLRNWPYAWTLFQQERSVVKGKVGIAPLPAFPGRTGVPTLGGWALAVPSRASHPEAAEELIRYLSSPAVQLTMALKVGYKPVHQDLYRDKRLLNVQPWIEHLLPAFLAAEPRPVTPYYLMFSQVLQPELSAVIVGTKSPLDAVRAIRKQTALILGRNMEGELS